MNREEKQFGIERKREASSSTESTESTDSKKKRILKKGDIASFFKKKYTCLIEKQTHHS